MNPTSKKHRSVKNLETREILEMDIKRSQSSRSILNFEDVRSMCDTMPSFRLSGNISASKALSLVSLVAASKSAIK